MKETPDFDVWWENYIKCADLANKSARELDDMRFIATQAFVAGVNRLQYMLDQQNK